MVITMGILLFVVLLWGLRVSMPFGFLLPGVGQHNPYFSNVVSGLSISYAYSHPQSIISRFVVPNCRGWQCLGWELLVWRYLCVLVDLICRSICWRSSCTHVSRNTTEFVDQLAVNLMVSWNSFRLDRNSSKAGTPWVQIAKMSSVYLNHIKGLRSCVERSFILAYP